MELRCTKLDFRTKQGFSMLAWARRKGIDGFTTVLVFLLLWRIRLIVSYICMFYARIVW
jgi:hypothetical protein